MEEDAAVKPIEPLLFRFGFLCHAAADPPRGSEVWTMIDRAWPKIRLGEFVIRHHPETQVSYRSDGDRHVALLGHAFAVDGSNENLLARIASATDEDLLALHDQLSGRFALLVTRGVEGRAFQDPFGARSLYYRSEGAFAVASHPELMFQAYDDPVSHEHWKLVKTQQFKSLYIRAMPGDVTLFENVLAVPPNHFYDFKRRRIVRFWPRHPKQNANFDTFFGEFDRYWKALADFLRQSPHRPVISLTGGIDSRMIAAAFKCYGLNFRTVTWKIYSYEPWEAEPIRKLVQHLGAPHSEVDEGNSGLNHAARISRFNAGNFRSPSRVVAGMSRLYGSEPNAVHVRGFGAEVLRGFYHSRPFTPQAYTAEALFRAYALIKQETYALDPTFERPARRAIEGFFERAGYSELDRYGYDVSDIYYWEFRVGTWASTVLNSMDAALYSIFGFNSRRVAEVAYGLPDSERLTKELFVRAIQRYDPAMAAIEYR